MKNILVTGDITVDNYIYEGERYSSHNKDARGTKVVTEIGGAFGVYRILKNLLDKSLGDMKKLKKAKKNKNKDKDCSQDVRYYVTENWEVCTSFNKLEKDKAMLISHSLWKPISCGEKKYTWRTENVLGYGDQQYTKRIAELIQKAIIPAKQSSVSKILIIDDAGYKFRDKSNKDNWLFNDSYDWIILKLTRPIASGELWNELKNNYAEKLITIVSADELRAEDYKIMRGYSWEQTIEDTRDALFSSTLYALMKSKHLIISFKNDGALWLNNSNSEKPVAKLLCDTELAEGEWSEKYKGKSYGYMTCLTAAIAFKIICNEDGVKNPDIASGIESGFSAMRDLIENGHCCVEEKKISEVLPTGFPAERLADEIRKPKHKLSTIEIPWQSPSELNNKDKWMITEMMQRSPWVKGEISLHGLATLVVYYGTSILTDYPHAKFGKLTTADRNEIEALRRIKQFMLEYKNNKNTNVPISFGVFGPPGAGKSFGVKQIAYEVFDKDSWLEFNLSQFSVDSLTELYGAFHQVRDKVLAGKTPVVFMDEFDSKNYVWLQYLLAPLQDGEFQEGQLKHSIGKCIFIFAGATSFTYDSFGIKKDNPDKKAYEDYKLKKGPDFISRLDSYLNVLGPNPRILNPDTDKLDPSDISYPLRRAIFISTKIKYDPYLPAQVDYGLVNALLRIPKYKHGARSLDKLLTILRSKDGTTLERSNIPADSQLEMYVDSLEFNRLLQELTDKLNYLPVDVLAPEIHESFRRLSIQNGWKINSRFDFPYSELDAEAQEDNKAAAKRIQFILSIVNLRIEKINETEEWDHCIDEEIKGHLEHHIQLLAKLEHDGWMMQRIKFDWKYGDKRDDENKVHNLLIPYSKLADNEKQKDKSSIRNYHEGLKLVGFRINWI